MARSIERDLRRFNEIVRGKIRKDLKQYVNHGELLGRKGKELVSIPVPNIDIPQFRHGKKGSGGTGQGEGEVGQPIGQGQDPGDGVGQAGSEPGQHVREVEVTLDELAEMLGFPEVVRMLCAILNGHTRKHSSGRLPAGHMILSGQ
jgi:uncharacterized sporulation protein YeaH/YhbH (DUF444 family)